MSQLELHRRLRAMKTAIPDADTAVRAGLFAAIAPNTNRVLLSAMATAEVAIELFRKDAREVGKNLQTTQAMRAGSALQTVGAILITEGSRRVLFRRTGELTIAVGTAVRVNSYRKLHKALRTQLHKDNYWGKKAENERAHTAASSRRTVRE